MHYRDDRAWEKPSQTAIAMEESYQKAIRLSNAATYNRPKPEEYHILEADIIDGKVEARTVVVFTDWYEKLCPECRGKGRNEIEICQKCFGNRKIKNKYGDACTKA